MNVLSVALLLVFVSLVNFGAWISAMAETSSEAVHHSRSYAFYEPEIIRHIVYQGEEKKEHMAYNHTASIEFFDGKFYVVWQGNAVNQEGAKGQKIYLSTSKDFVNWSEPVAFVTESAKNPIVGPHPQKQPNLLAYSEKELWCVWLLSAGQQKLGGIYLSKLTSASNGSWVNKRILHRFGLTIDRHEITSIYTAQNPVQLSSGRVLVGLTFISKTSNKSRFPRRWAGFLYTDDEGDTWNLSNFISLPEDRSAPWEAHAYEQAEGKLRVFIRNIGRTLTRPVGPLSTTTGTGTQKGEPLIFEEDAWTSWMETVSSRIHSFRLSSGRYVMLHHDVYTPVRAYHTRLNGALFFSRTGADDYVAGPGFSRPNEVIAYPEGIEHDGKIFLVYTLGLPKEEPRSIERVIIDPTPAADQFYIWPRDKKIVNPFWNRRKEAWWEEARKRPYTRPSRTRTDQRDVLVFKMEGSAGVEIDPIDFEDGQSLELRFEIKVKSVQKLGNLVLCSFGDQIPIRIGVPSNRPNRLYAYGYGHRWQPVGDFPPEKWLKITVTFRKETFSVTVGNEEPKTFRNPIVSPNPRLYFGDGYEIDYYPSNRGSEFLIVLNSIRTSVQ